MLKIKPKQRTKINALVRKTCCNCYKGNCLLLDDGEETKCVQLISRYGIYCNYFLKAVLPAEKELYTEILRQNGSNHRYRPRLREYENGELLFSDGHHRL